MASIEWVETLIDAHTGAEVDALVANLREHIPQAELYVGLGPEILSGAVPPTRYVVWALVGVPGQSKEATLTVLRDALTTLGVRFDADARAATLDMAVIFL